MPLPLKTLASNCELEQIWHFAATPFHEECVAAVRSAAVGNAIAHMDLVSGAGHDACYAARVAPTAMIFVPCKDGISHNEIESATPEDLAAGCQVLLDAALRLAGSTLLSERTQSRVNCETDVYQRLSLK